MSVPVADRRQEDSIAPVQSGDVGTAAGAASLNGLRVLLVEDEALVRLDFAQILRDAGATIVAEAGSLEEGLDKARATVVDAAILDKNLNGESSLPLARLLAGQGVAIVFVSGYRAADQSDEQKKEAHVHLQKPVSPQALVAALASAVSSRIGRN